MIENFFKNCRVMKNEYDALSARSDYHDKWFVLAPFSNTIVAVFETREGAVDFVVALNNL